MQTREMETGGEQLRLKQDDLLWPLSSSSRAVGPRDCRRPGSINPTRGRKAGVGDLGEGRVERTGGALFG
jgi:hypothetical protein